MASVTTHLKKNITLYLTASFLLIMVVCYFVISPFQQFINEFWEVIWSKDEQRIVEWFKSFHLLGPVFIILLMVLQMFMVVFPTWLPMIVASLGYGPVFGFLISVTAVFVSSTIGFYIGEQLSTTSKNNLIGESNFEKLSGFMKKYGFWAIVLFRISPILSNDAISFIAGISEMGFRKYITATMVGIIPLAAAISYFARDIETLKTGLYWIGGAGILIYGLYVYLQYRRNDD